MCGSRGSLRKFIAVSPPSLRFLSAQLPRGVLMTDGGRVGCLVPVLTSCCWGYRPCFTCPHPPRRHCCFAPLSACSSGVVDMPKRAPAPHPPGYAWSAWSTLRRAEHDSDAPPPTPPFSGDYTLLEKLFGQTSNNKARMTLKQQVLDEADIPTNPERVRHI